MKNGEFAALAVRQLTHFYFKCSVTLTAPLKIGGNKLETHQFGENTELKLPK
jgi:hypothetical protein